MVQVKLFIQKKNNVFFSIFFIYYLGLSPPSQVPWEQKPIPHWADHKPPPHTMSQAPPPPHTHPPPQTTHSQMGGYVPQYWYQPETNPSLLT